MCVPAGWMAVAASSSGGVAQMRRPYFNNNVGTGTVGDGGVAMAPHGRRRSAAVVMRANAPEGGGEAGGDERAPVLFGPPIGALVKIVAEDSYW